METLQYFQFCNWQSKVWWRVKWHRTWIHIPVGLRNWASLRITGINQCALFRNSKGNHWKNYWRIAMLSLLYPLNNSYFFIDHILNKTNEKTEAKPKNTNMLRMATPEALQTQSLQSSDVTSFGCYILLENMCNHRLFRILFLLFAFIFTWKTFAVPKT